MNQKQIVFSLLTVVIIGGFLIGNEVFNQEEENVSSAYAEQITVLEGDIFRINNTSPPSQLTRTQDVEIVFSNYKDFLLVGKGVRIPTYSDEPQYTTLYLLNSDGTEIRKVTEQQIEYALLSPIGDYIFYLTANGDIFKQDTNSGQEEQMTSFATSFTISPDGSYLSFLKLPTEWTPGEMGWETKGITILDTLTKEETLLTTGELDHLAYWTPDSSRLLVSGGTNDGNGAIFIVDSDGDNRTQLTATSEWHYYDNELIPILSTQPIISADGRIIIYEADQSIWMLELDLEKRSLIQAKRIAYGKNLQWVETGKIFSLQSSDKTLILMNTEGQVVR